MVGHHPDQVTAAIFITFSGNCKRALSFYQNVFGGALQLDTFEKEVSGYTDTPVVSGSLVSDRIAIHGSDLVHNEGRKLGNYMSIFLRCENADERNDLIEKLGFDKNGLPGHRGAEQGLIEGTDAFEVRWVLGI